MKNDTFSTQKKLIFSSILYENDHDLSNGRSRSLAFFKYKRPVESLFGISNYITVMHLYHDPNRHFIHTLSIFLALTFDL